MKAMSLPSGLQGVLLSAYMKVTAAATKIREKNGFCFRSGVNGS